VHLLVMCCKYVQNARYTQFQDFLSSVFTYRAKTTVSHPRKTWA